MSVKRTLNIAACTVVALIVMTTAATAVTIDYVQPGGVARPIAGYFAVFGTGFQPGAHVWLNSPYDRLLGSDEVVHSATSMSFYVEIPSTAYAGSYDVYVQNPGEPEVFKAGAFRVADTAFSGEGVFSIEQTRAAGVGQVGAATLYMNNTWQPQADTVWVTVSWDDDVLAYVSTDWKIGILHSAMSSATYAQFLQCVDRTNDLPNGRVALAEISFEVLKAGSSPLEIRVDRVTALDIDGLDKDGITVDHKPTASAIPGTFVAGAAPVTTTPTPVAVLPADTLAPVTIQPVAVTPAMTTSPRQPAFVFGKRYAVGNPGTFLGTRYGSGGTPTAAGGQRTVAAPVETGKPGSRAYGITPPTGQFVRWYPAARWAAGIK